MKIFNKISRLPEFEKDFKKLLKRFRTLEDDLTVFIEKQLNLYHKLHKDNKGIFLITGLSIECPGSPLAGVGFQRFSHRRSRR